MKSLYFWIITACVTLSTLSCFFEPQGGQFGDHIFVAASETNLDEEEDDDDDRDQGRLLCLEDRRCLDSCEDTYDGDDEPEGKIQACEKLRYNIAIQFEGILETLEDPEDTKLNNISSSAFGELIEISVEPWVRSTDRIKSSEAEDLLAWVAKNQKVSKAIVRAYRNYETSFDEYEGVFNLLSEITEGSGNCSNFCGRVEHPIVGSSTSFLDIVHSEGNSSAGSIICSLSDRECTETELEETACSGVKALCEGNRVNLISSARTTSSRFNSGSSSSSRSSGFNIDDLYDSVVAIDVLTYICPLDGGAGGNVDSTLRGTVETCHNACSGESNIQACFATCASDSGCETPKLFYGSGVFTTSNQVLTNHHVVKFIVEDTKVTDEGDACSGNTCTHFGFSLLGEVLTHSGTEHIISQATWWDSDNDLALLELADSYNSAHIPRHGSYANLRVLDELTTVGTPNYNRWTFSRGHLTNKRVNGYPNYMAFSIPIGGGNSGGPIFNSSGELVGLVAGSFAGYDNLNIGPHIDIIKRRLSSSSNGDLTGTSGMRRPVYLLNRDLSSSRRLRSRMSSAIRSFR